jgi:hypothetical protein
MGVFAFPFVFPTFHSHQPFFYIVRLRHGNDLLLFEFLLKTFKDFDGSCYSFPKIVGFLCTTSLPEKNKCI